MSHQPSVSVEHMSAPSMAQTFAPGSNFQVFSSQKQYKAEIRSTQGSKFTDFFCASSAFCFFFEYIGTINA